MQQSEQKLASRINRDIVEKLDMLIIDILKMQNCLFKIFNSVPPEVKPTSNCLPVFLQSSLK